MFSKLLGSDDEGASNWWEVGQDSWDMTQEYGYSDYMFNTACYFQGVNDFPRLERWIDDYIEVIRDLSRAETPLYVW